MARLSGIVVALLFLAACAVSEPGGDNGNTGGQPDGSIGSMCGGIAGFQCEAEGSYCAVEPGVCHEVADYAGVCKPKPQVCTMDYRPVCGCDGETYGNACSAAGAGVSVAYDGVCRKEN